MAARGAVAQRRAGRSSAGAELVRVALALVPVVTAGVVIQVSGADGVVSVLLLFTAVVVAALGGTVAGVVAALAAAGTAAVWLAEPRGQLLTVHEDLAALVTFLAMGIVVGTLVQRLDDARRRAARREREARTRLLLSDQLLSGAPLDVVARAATEAMLELTDLSRIVLDGEGIHAEARRGDESGPLEVIDGAVGVRVAPPRGRRAAAQDRELVRSLASVVHAGLAQAASQREVADARLEAELSRSRAVFFAAAGHNLRTPLASLGAAVSVLADDDGTLAVEDRAEMLATTRTELGRLVHLVDKVLALSRIEAGPLEPQLDEVDLNGLAQAAVRRLGPTGAHHGFHLDIPVELEGLRLDVTMTEQVLLNLLENAVQAAPAGTTVTVAARRLGDRVVLEVVDHGPGVDPADRQQIFEEYVRGDALTGRDGSGLGLAIVRALVGAQGGEVACVPTPGGGATMAMTFPVRSDHPTPASSGPVAGRSGGDRPGAVAGAVEAGAR